MITGLVINWMFGWANNPELKFTLDEEPGKAYYKKTPTEEGMLYYAVSGDVVYHYLQTRSHSGFGGRKINCTMEDGSTEILHGPWDSGVGHVNKYTDLRIISTSYTYPDKSYSGYYGGYMLVHPVITCLKSLHPLLDLDSSPFQSTGANDAQAAVILHGTKMKSDTVKFHLDKSLADQIGYYQWGDSEYQTQNTYFTIFGDLRPDDWYLKKVNEARWFEGIAV